MKKPNLVDRLRLRSTDLLGNWRLFRLTSQVAGHSRPLPGQKPVAFFNASTRLNGVSLNAAFSYLVACGVQLENVPVVYFACRAGMSRCVLGTDRDNVEKPPPCAGCITQSENLFSHAPVVWFDYSRDEHIASGLANHTLAELIDFQIDLPDARGDSRVIPLGQLVLPSIRWALRLNHLRDDLPTRLLYKEYILSAWSIAKEFQAFLDNVDPMVVVVFNGILYPEAIARWVAVQRGIRVVTHEVGFQPFSGFYSDREATAYPIDIPDEFELTPERNSELETILEKRFEGKFTMAGIRFWPEMVGLGADFEQRAASFRQVVPVFTNVVYDTSQVHANTVFPHMFAWLNLILEIIRGHPETLFVIRAHPDELRPGKESRESVPMWVKQKQVDRLPNTIFVDPNEYLSSYELIQRSKFVMVYNSSIGLEAAVIGKAVLCGGKARYTAYPTVYFPRSPEQYRQMAEEFLDNPGDIEIPAEFVRNARRFMYYQFFKSSLRFDEFLEAHRRPGYVLLRPISWRSLTRERSRTMSVLLDGILHGEPFLLSKG